MPGRSILGVGINCLRSSLQRSGSAICEQLGSLEIVSRGESLSAEGDTTVVTTKPPDHTRFTLAFEGTVTYPAPAGRVTVEAASRSRTVRRCEGRGRPVHAAESVHLPSHLHSSPHNRGAHLDGRYEELARREAEHWGGAGHDPENPQIWDDPELQEIFFGAEERHFYARAEAIGPRVLELGCGEGDLAWELARGGLDVTAIDLSPVRIQAAAARATEDADNPRARAPSPTFVVGDLNTMELPAGPFDGAIAHDALHHVAELDALFARLERVLRPGGTLLVFDFAGMGRIARMLSAALVAVFPTYMPYARKWRLRRRLGAFLASEREKRDALERGAGGALHDASPFEGISQESIVPAIARRFDIVEHRSFLPFWWYLAPKLRLGGYRHAMARRFRAWDDGLQRSGLARGAYFIVEARSRVRAR